MTIRRWFFVPKEEGIAKKPVYLYETQSKTAKSSLISLPKSKTKGEPGPVLKVETTEGKSAKIVDKCMV